jgi:hypothetical protein
VTATAQWYSLTNETPSLDYVPGFMSGTQAQNQLVDTTMFFAFIVQYYVYQTDIDSVGRNGTTRCALRANRHTTWFTANCTRECLECLHR